MLMQRSCAGASMDVKQLVNMLPQNLWLELTADILGPLRNISKTSASVSSGFQTREN